MIRGFRIENLRSIKDTGDLKIKKINVLVGRNSSGKSTVLRFLPLLRQSVEQETRGAMLWYGRLVDFGSFENAARNHNLERGIRFEFDVVLSGRRANVFRRLTRPTLKSIEARGEVALKASVSISANDEGVGIVREVVITMGHDVVRVSADSSGELISVEAMGEKVLLDEDEEWWLAPGTIMPSLMLFQEVDEEEEDEGGLSDSGRRYTEPVDFPFRDKVVNGLRSIVHGRTSDERLFSISGRLAYGDEESFYRQLLSLPGTSAAMLDRFAKLGPSSPAIRALRRNVLLSRLEQLMEAIDDELKEFAANVRYIEPLRAIAERYYRRQDLAVDEIDSRGANTAMYLSSLRSSELESLQEWMRSNVGFTVHVDRSPGHVQVMVEDGVHGARNVADLGFGYSQLLPIVLQLWQARETAEVMEEAILIAMEQPELHLHPHYQARLAEVIAATASIGGAVPVSMFVETHSDHFVNRLGALVAEGRLDRENIQILVVNDDGLEGESSVVAVEFDSEGLLGDNWPFGFFSPGAL